MGKAARLGIFFSLLGAVVGLCVFTAMAYLRSAPPTISYLDAQPSGQPVHLHLQVVGDIGYGAHSTWVSYLTQAPNGAWVHTTEWDLPAHRTIDVTIDQYDSGSPLRNQTFGLVQGVAGGVEYLNGKPVSLVNSNEGNGVGHTFAVPSLGINVPLPGVNGSAKSFCDVAAPCPTSALHNVVTFSFQTPGPGQYRWQCFVPCGVGYLFGNGGPMGTMGYMAGMLKVVSTPGGVA